MSGAAPRQKSGIAPGVEAAIARIKTFSVVTIIVTLTVVTHTSLTATSVTLW